MDAPNDYITVTQTPHIRTLEFLRKPQTKKARANVEYAILGIGCMAQR